jgi:predicted amidohydrolase YtcJ/lysophospholipase L1-like esterase
MRLLGALMIMGVMMFSCQNRIQTADRVFRNGRFWTVDANQPRAAVVGIKNGRFNYVGQEIPDGLVGRETEVIDLENRFVLPGMTDAHLHLLTGGYSLSQIDLRHCRSKAEFIEKISTYVKKMPPGEWILGGNWDHTLWPAAEGLPARSWIDKMTAANPVLINRLDGHMALANSLALQLAGIDKNVNTPPGGVISRDQQGELTGILKDAAMNLVNRIIPEPGPEFKLMAAENAVRYLLENGVTSAHDMGNLTDLAVYKELITQNKLKVRLTCYIPIVDWQELSSVTDGTVDPELLKVNGVKSFMDGSLGSGTARFFEPYINDPQNRGIWDEQAIPPEKIFERLKAVDSSGKQVAVHAIGDEANARLLEFYRKIRAGSGRRDQRFRIEHAQHLRWEDIPMFARLGVIASMQPFHCIDDGRWAEERIGPARCRSAYAFRTLLDSGAVLAFGSDWYVAPASPLWGIYAAVTRRTLDDKNPDGWIPEQKIGVEEAIRCYTINGAFADFSEREKGSLEKGKLADFVVLSEDLTKINPVDIKGVQVLRTVVGGETVFENKSMDNKFFPADNSFIQYTGRIDFSDPQKPKLAGAGCYLQGSFKGSSIEMVLQDQHLNGNRNYLSVVLDGEYQGRIRTVTGQNCYVLAEKLENGEHTILVSKATESAIGYVEFTGFNCHELLPAPEKPERKIEFIGNSITCGTGLDLSGIPCDSADWYDQHNAYLAFGPLLARRLNAQWLLSSVSGIGIERNWNGIGPTMPQVYQNTYLGSDSAKLWDFSSYVPDLVVVSLGTNDFSDGDGKIPRALPDSTKFITAYLQFLKTIRRNYPQAVICCVSSPVMQGEKSRILRQYLELIVDSMHDQENDARVTKFFFAKIYDHGCNSHPDRREHEQMADELEPFLKQVMQW